MTLNDFNNIRVEYSVGARVIMFSLVDTSANKSIIVPKNISKIIIEYEQNGALYSYESLLSFHCNSCLIILSNLQEDSDISFRVYVVYQKNDIEFYRVSLTNVINEHTLPLGNITYNILERNTLNENIINQLESTMNNVIDYINNLGTYVDENFDEYAQYAKNIPIKYNSSIATADAIYYKYCDEEFGRVRTSGGSYFRNDVMFHELRHRYGISSLGTTFTRDDTNDNYSSLFNFIEDKFTVLHNALRFESGRNDAKVWIFEAHSNILEGSYTNDGDYNYLAANYIKALVWYASHRTTDPDESKIRIIAPLNIELISGTLNIGDISYNIILNTYDKGNARLSQEEAKVNTQITISEIIPIEGYEFGSLIVKENVNENIIQTTNNGLTGIDQEFYFIMPDNHVNVNIYFSKIPQNSPEIYNNRSNYKKTEIKKSDKKKTINIGNYQYLFEYLKNGEDFNDIGCSNSFVILRNFEIVNNIIYDKDIFFIEKNIYDKIISNNSFNNICYPLYKNNNLFFTDNYELFTDYNIEFKDIAYPIYQKNSRNEENLANILCDKIRIYNPTIQKNLDYIIYTDNYINNVHFHYFCGINNTFNKKYCGEIQMNNNRYIEYIEVNIPNISKLFDKNNKYYIHEDFNKIYEYNMENLNDIELLNYFNTNKSRKLNNNLYLYNIIQPFIIEKEKNENEKTVYIKTFINDEYFKFNNHYINTSINIILYPYKNIDNNIYILNDELDSASSFISYTEYFNLSSRLGFDHGIISLINEFKFPGKSKRSYEDLTHLTKEEIIEQKISEIYVIDHQVTEYYNMYFLNENINDIEENYEDYFDDINTESIRSTGYIIQISDDIKFKDIIWESVINTDNDKDNFIYDFSFSLNNMIDSWDQLNEILIIRALFIDKRLNKKIVGNNVVLTKEWFKYLINKTTVNNILFNYNNLIENNFMNVNTGFNFIDNITCVIKEENNSNTNISINNDINNTKIIYKPIFYKVQDLQNIRLRNGITQKIGVNLGDYLNKVNLFILNIDNLTIKESSRNDVYVIFEINANNIESNSGYYNILDENFEYISSGNYIKY